MAAVAPARRASVQFAEDDSFAGESRVKVTPPGIPPKPPDVVHIGRARVELIWDAPLFTGGSAVTKYTVASREGGEGSFVQLHVTADAQCAATVPVPSSTWLEFTVSAINMAGTGPPSKVSMPVLTYARRGGGRRRRRDGSDGDGGRLGERGSEEGEEGGRQPARSQSSLSRSFSQRASSSASVDTILAAGLRAGTLAVASADDDADDEAWEEEEEEGGAVVGAVEEAEAAVLAAAAEGSEARAERRGSSNAATLAARYAEVHAALSSLEASRSAALGRRLTDDELIASASYRALARELTELRERRDEAEAAAEAQWRANRDWQDALMRLGFEPGARLQQLELEQAQWLMEQNRRHGGKQASKQEQLGSRRFV